MLIQLYCIFALFDAWTYSQKFWEKLKTVGVPILYFLQLPSGVPIFDYKLIRQKVQKYSIWFVCYRRSVNQIYLFNSVQLLVMFLFTIKSYHCQYFLYDQNKFERNVNVYDPSILVVTQQAWIVCQS